MESGNISNKKQHYNLDHRHVAQLVTQDRAGKRWWGRQMQAGLYFDVRHSLLNCSHDHLQHSRICRSGETENNTLDQELLLLLNGDYVLRINLLCRTPVQPR